MVGAKLLMSSGFGMDRFDTEIVLVDGDDDGGC